MSAETHIQLSDSELSRSSLNFPVVGIGASAGGLQALVKFFSGIPERTGMAFVVLVHLSPKHTSTLPALIERATPMRVLSVDKPVPIEADTVYVIAPNKMLSMNDGYLRLADMERPHGKHVVVDLFFRTLALVHRERAFAVVLSGTGADGAVGIARIREQGGVSFAQSPEDAEFDGMPRAAIDTGVIDWVLPVADIPAKLIQLARNARTIELPAADDGEPLPVAPPPSPQALQQAEEALKEILLMLRARTGHDFRNYKRATVLRRLERRLQVHGLPNLPAYRAFMHSQSEEGAALLKDLLIGVTNFFRDADAFEALRREAIAPAFEREDLMPGGLRAWVAGCATGEEAYSLAMMLCEQASLLPQPPKIHVFATDIDEGAIGTARMGTYPSSIATDVSTERLRRFFDRDGDSYRIRKEVREKVMFAVHNLLHDPPFSKLDLITCRNLLIYLDRDVHAEILEMFHFALKPGGLLFLGSSESADTASQFFTVVDKKHRIYRANTGARTVRYTPSLPAGTSIHPMTPQQLEQRNDKRRLGFAELHRRLAEQHAPPSVLIDMDSTIVHLSAHAGRFLRHNEGSPSHNLMALVLPELRLELRSAVFQAMRSGQSVEARRVRLQRDGKDLQVNMIARPVHEPEIAPGPLVLVLFDEVEVSMAPDAVDSAGDRDPVIVQLEEELTRTKEQLQNTIEQSDTSTEELKASNEELQAINEELRSTTEELETSKEELQSINEELLTVNHELKSKVEETGKINDDLQNLIASTDIATLFIDRSMSIKRYTPHATKLFNLIPTDIGRSLLDITHKLEYESLADDATEAFQSLRMIEREVTTHGGRWYLARVLPYRTAEDRIDGAVLTFVDITGRRKAEETMRLIADSTRDYAIATMDLEGRILSWNQGAEKVFGFSEPEAIGHPISMLFVPEDRISGIVEEELRRAREEGRAEDDRWHLRKDGARIFCSGITSPLYDEGRLRGYAKIARDMTEKRRVDALREAELEEAAARRAEALAASELKDEFLAVMSHELKNPLNLIQLNADLLARMPESRDIEAVQRVAALIRRTVASQAQIIDDLLDLSRVNTGKLALHRAVVDWTVGVETIVSAKREEAAGKGVELIVDIPERPLSVDADPVRIEQIVWNLLSNAVKFTPRGGRVTVRLATEGECARLDVVDTGRGIAPSMLPRVFEMFGQAEGSARQHGGLGIGLAVVKHLAVLHGGRVVAESEGPNKGSRFSVWLPLARSAPRAGDGALDASHPRLAARRLLLVDEDGQSAEALQALLQSEGLQVVAATTGLQALETAQQGGFDAVLTDLAIQDMDGHALLQALRRDPRTAGLPVLALSGMARPVDVRRAMDAGFRAHLAKPVVLERLLAALDEVFSGAA
jgi:two-component system, chemotaxis family, CheB/CheR fusion protein